MDMTANLVVEHDQELVADMQPSALKNKLLKNAVEGCWVSCDYHPTYLLFSFGPISHRSVLQQQLPSL
jgi:hypothetical protein